MHADLTPVQLQRLQEHQKKFRRPAFFVQLVLIVALIAGKPDFRQTENEKGKDHQKRH